MPIEGKRLKNNARYTPLYEATHDVETGGWKNDEVGQAAKATGNTDRNYIVQSALDRGREVKEGSHGGLIYKPKKASQPSEWGQKYKERKGINGNKAIDPETNPTFAERVTSPTGMTHDEFVEAQRNGSRGTAEPKLTNYGEPIGPPTESAFNEQKNRTQLEAEFAGLYGYVPSYTMPTDEIQDWINKETTRRTEELNGYYLNNTNPSTPTAASTPATPTQTYEGLKATNVPDTGDSRGILGGLSGGVANALDAAQNIRTPEDDLMAQYEMYLPQRQTPPAAPLTDLSGSQAERRSAFDAAQRIASEDTLMGDTYPEMQTGSGYKGEPLPLDQQRRMYSGLATSVIPGSGSQQGGVYKQADGSYSTPESRVKEELDAAYEDYKAMVDNTRGFDDEEDRKYSYDPYTVYNGSRSFLRASEVNPEFERRINDAQQRFGIPLEVLASQVANQPDFYAYIMAKIAEQKR